MSSLKHAGSDGLIALSFLIAISPEWCYGQQTEINKVPFHFQDRQYARLTLPLKYLSKPFTFTKG